jgi:hypothetical protein
VVPPDTKNSIQQEYLARDTLAKAVFSLYALAHTQTGIVHSPEYLVLSTLDNLTHQKKSINLMLFFYHSTFITQLFCFSSSAFNAPVGTCFFAFDAVASAVNTIIVPPYTIGITRINSLRPVRIHNLLSFQMFLSVIFSCLLSVGAASQ